jgi:hypothetical protein
MNYVCKVTKKIIVIGSNLGNSLQTSRVYAGKKVILQQENKKP